MKNAFSIDVEDWYHQIGNPHPPYQRENWDKNTPRIEDSFHRLLGILDEFGVKGTMFFLGYIADKYPHLVKLAADAGHEIASHGWWHEPLHSQSPEEFYNDIADTKHLLEDLTGTEIKGYRAPSFSLTDKTQWAYVQLAKAGYSYSSSVYPAKRADGGWPGINLPQKINTLYGTVTELPIALAPWPWSSFSPFGGGYFRLFPAPYFYIMHKMINNKPLNFYIHPRDIDKGQPPTVASSLRKLRADMGIQGCENKLRKILNKYEWGRIDEVYKSHLSSSTLFPSLSI